MTVAFIKYDQVTERVSFQVADAKESKKMDFTYLAAKALIEEPVDATTSGANSLIAIKSTLIEKGGVAWLDSEIQKFQQGLVNGEGAMIPGKL